ncbi:MAG TPA: DUF4159 domain-containing protein [Vicinamibacterales bacterium]
MLGRRASIGLLVLAAILVSGGYTYAQFGRDIFDGFRGLRGEQGDPAELPQQPWPDRNVAACHMLYTSVRREANGAGWRTDYPWGGRHLLIRLSEITKTRVSWLTPTVPHAWLVRLTDDALFECPYVMASDVGTIGLTQEEAARLRLYLEKGGFLWVDDFWGNAAWEHWSREFGKAMPPSEYPIEDVPFSDPIFRTMFEVKAVPQVTSIRFWRASRGRNTSERGAESAVPHLRAIRDKRGRIMAVMTHNTDVSDSWEREGDDPQFFYQFSPNGYALGINVLLYAMTH